MTIKMTFNGTRRTIQMFKPSKIINNECRINSTHLFCDKNLTQDYSMYVFNGSNVIKIRKNVISFPKNVMNFPKNVMSCFFQSIHKNRLKTSIILHKYCGKSS